MRPALQARRRASPAEMVSPVSRWATLRAPVRVVWSRVTTTVAAVLGCRWSVGRCSRSSAKARPRRCLQSGLGRSPERGRSPVVRMRRGAVIDSRTFFSTAAARRGTVKWPLVVPSALSWKVSEHRSRAVSSSVRTRSFSWASTAAVSGSTVARTRLARRRSWSGSKRWACCTRVASTVARCSGLTVVGSWSLAVRITAAWAGESRPSSRAVAVVSWPVCSSVARWTSRAAVVRLVLVCWAVQASVPENPASWAVPALSAAARILSLTASSRRATRSSERTAAACSPLASGVPAPASIRSRVVSSSTTPASTG